MGNARTKNEGDAAIDEMSASIAAWPSFLGKGKAMFHHCKHFLSLNSELWCFKASIFFLVLNHYSHG